VVSPGKEHSAAKARPGLIGVLEKLGDQQPESFSFISTGTSAASARGNLAGALTPLAVAALEWCPTLVHRA